jgi:hypothetical protein
VETCVVGTDATVLSDAMFGEKPVFGRPARLARPGQVMVQATVRTVSRARERACPFVWHAGAVCGFVFGVAAGRLSEVS